ncbi:MULTISPECIES: c-type cytochrome [Sphingomonadales]|jgi:mono/diheme cytochrome c family protein|uniref:Cytochrome c domain-containing protein n=2 Tax=Sphingomonadales TaxID=204457 RepID=A0A916YML1_9SPHN|nr:MULTISPECIES: cytochrome c [Sphingomonadales]MCT2401906.1 cytochrome c [Novosphingobium mangrovi (ex Huang et al. 2023)]PEQ10892.1 p-cresol methylhydroxylase [Novosphingobium sp. PC22D]GGD51687.1 hypothetical protein GCM10010989_27270 [Croceicoccus pelagius]
MNKLLVLSLLATLGACSSKQGEVVADGAENYERYCAGCHNPGPGHGGTMLLAEKGAPVPSLIGRKDLDYDYLHSVVRQGLIEMPPFRPTELSDTEIKQIYDHIMAQKLPPAKAQPAKNKTP